jgi:hypothetical protein
MPLRSYDITCSFLSAKWAFYSHSPRFFYLILFKICSIRAPLIKIGRRFSWLYPGPVITFYSIKKVNLQALAMAYR